MSRINDKLGLKPAGKRAIMKDAGKDAASRAVTSRQCPKCFHRWVTDGLIHGKRVLMCAWCSNTEGFL